MPNPSEISEKAKKEFGYDDNLNEISIAYKYKDLRKIVISYFDHRIWFLTEAALCVIVSCILGDLANPLPSQ